MVFPKVNEVPYDPSFEFWDLGEIYGEEFSKKMEALGRLGTMLMTTPLDAKRYSLFNSLEGFLRKLLPVRFNLSRVEVRDTEVFARIFADTGRFWIYLGDLPRGKGYERWNNTKVSYENLN